jgi:uncharacterized membrane protein YphA (DoxX/SURF4 family)
MNIILWTLQVLLAALFMWHGWLFLVPPAELVEIMNAEFPLWFRISLGVVEVLASVGLILPGVTRIMPRLTAFTAMGLMIVMACATLLHSYKGQTGSAITTAVVFVILAFVAYTRWKVKPITGKRK